MNITLQNTGKRFNRDWIFRHLDFNFVQGNFYAITGSNGSGKSTLLQIIAGATMHNEGIVSYNQVPVENAYQNISIAAPYLDLIEEMTATEFLNFHHSFKPLTKTALQILNIVGIEKAANKQIRYFSSGMKQRLKLGQAFFSNTSVLLLDEPTTNLDAEGIALYNNLWKHNTSNRLVIVSSNDNAEYSACSEIITMGNYK
ncbi:MAG: ABC transporter ATP-binding protein [Ferruginibacter sp.]|nr:ABC transporter ATP-binding protein [Ferruginibacter sp.]